MATIVLVEPQHPGNVGAVARVMSNFGCDELVLVGGCEIDDDAKARAKAGRPLLETMADAGMIVDLTHLADDAFRETLDAFSGPVLASHNNCRALVPGCRQFTDEQIQAIIERGGVIGAALDAWMIYPGWIKGETQPEVVSLDDLVDHVVHICELAGNAEHVGIGSDLDGGYGNEQTPHDLGTIADLQKLAPLLSARGFGDDDVERFMRGNWVRFFSQHLPA